MDGRKKGYLGTYAGAQDTDMALDTQTDTTKE